MWVPARNMRGTAYATKSLDGTARNTAKLMSISTLWDFVCTLPLFKFGVSTQLGLLSWPAAVVLSFLLLWASNAAGEKATDRSNSIASRTASFSLLAFLFLSLAKTAFSGVGIDLFIGTRGVASRYAEQLVEIKIEGDQKELSRLREGTPQLSAAKAECDRLQQQLAGIDRSTNEKAFQSVYVLAYGSKAAEAENAGFTPKQLQAKYGSVSQVPGACRQQGLLQELERERESELRTALDRKQQAKQSMPALAFLEKEEPEIYLENFRQKGNSVEFVNGTTAVAQATDQFWTQLLAGKFGALGFSLFFLIVSIVLTALATLLIYQLGMIPGIKASFSDDVQAARDARLDSYRKILETQEEEF
jgi:hypothetical protein